MAEKTARYIIRVANTDLEGGKQIETALTKITGVGRQLAHAICVVSGIDPRKLAGNVSEKEEAQLNEVVKNPGKSGIPSWMLNRQKDPETGENIHLVGPNVKFVRDNDIKAMRKLRSYKGQRHAANLTVRGQRTASNFRKNKTRGSSRLKSLRRK